MGKLKDRLGVVARSLGYSERGFCLACGLRPDYISHLGDYIKDGDIQRIFNSFPLVNLYYIFLGVGPALCGGSNTPDTMAIIRFVCDEYREMKIENHLLTAENESLKNVIKTECKKNVENP